MNNFRYMLILNIVFHASIFADMQTDKRMKAEDASTDMKPASADKRMKAAAASADMKVSTDKQVRRIQ